MQKEKTPLQLQLSPVSVGVDEEWWFHGIWVSKLQAAALLVSPWTPPLQYCLLSPVLGPCLCPSLPLPGGLCLPVCSFSPQPLHFPASFSSASPFCLCVFLFLPLLILWFLRQPFPLPGPQGSQLQPGSAPLGVVPTSLSCWPPGLFLLPSEALPV